jgi:hypothetical protein
VRNSVEHNRERRPFQRLIQADPPYRHRRHSRRSVTCSLRTACFSHKTRRSFRSASGSARSRNCRCFQGWSCSCKVSRSLSARSKNQTAVHEGEVFAGVQGVLFAGAESWPTVSVSYVRRVHTSVAPELDVGTFRQSTSILLSEDLLGFHFDYERDSRGAGARRSTSSPIRTNTIPSRIPSGG